MKSSRSWRPTRFRCLHEGFQRVSNPRRKNKKLLYNLFCLGFSWTPDLGFGAKRLFRQRWWQRWLMLGPTRHFCSCGPRAGWFLLKACSVNIPGSNFIVVALNLDRLVY